VDPADQISGTNAKWRQHTALPISISDQLIVPSYSEAGLEIKALTINPMYVKFKSSIDLCANPQMKNRLFSEEGK